MNRSANIVQVLVMAMPLIAVCAVGFADSAAQPRQFQLQAKSPHFWDLVDPDAQLSVVRYGLRIYRRAGVG